jgi:hypothetical protein
VWVEALHAVRYALAPVTEAQAHALVESLPGAALLRGFRGRPPADLDALVRATIALSRLAADLGSTLDTLEINPFIVGPAGAGGLAVDVVAIPAAASERGEAGVAP